MILTGSNDSVSDSDGFDSAEVSVLVGFFGFVNKSAKKYKINLVYQCSFES